MDDCKSKAIIGAHICSPRSSVRRGLFVQVKEGSDTNLTGEELDQHLSDLEKRIAQVGFRAGKDFTLNLDLTTHLP